MNFDSLLYLLLGGILGFSIVANAATFFTLRASEKKRWIVSVERRRNTGLEIEHTREYLMMVTWDPYGKGGDRGPPQYTYEAEIAFEFHTRAAAEMAAVWVGGVVEEYGHDEEYGEYAP